MDQYSLSCSDAVDMTYRVWGDNHKESVLIVHGLGSDGRQFWGDAEYLAAQGYKCIVPDLRGHGDTNRPIPFKKQTMSVPKMAEDLQRLIDHAGVGRVHLAGNSMGGVAGLALIERNPSAVSSLCTFGATYYLSFPAIVPWFQYVIARLMGPRRLSELVAKSVTDHEETRAFVRKTYADIDPRLTYTVQKTLRKYDYRRAAVEFVGPILMIRGEKDASINSHLSETLAAMENQPNFELIDLPAAGHFTNLDRPEAFREILLRFLAKS